MPKNTPITPKRRKAQRAALAEERRTLEAIIAEPAAKRTADGRVGEIIYAAAKRRLMQLDDAAACQPRALPDLGDGDAGPAAAGRGEIEVAQVGQMVERKKSGRMVPASVRVVRRAVPAPLRRLSEDLRDAAERYQGLAETVGAVRCIAEGGGGGGGCSDGGAAARTEDAGAWRNTRRAINGGPVSARAVVADLAVAVGGRRFAPAILDVVDMLVIEGRAVAAVLRAYGIEDAKAARSALDQAFAAAMRRLRGSVGA